MTRIWRLSGAGNDFLALTDPGDPPSAETVRAWCRRGISLGADGLFRLERTGPGTIRMTHFNADGGRARLCVNGTRCAARLALELGWAEGSVVLETDVGRVTAREAGQSEIEIDAPLPEGSPSRFDLGDARLGEAWQLTVGVPHLVVTWNGSLAECPVASLGAEWRAHPDLGPEGANVDFVRFPSPHRLEIRTFERGVEAETLACGSGVLAAVACGLAAGRLAFPVEVTVQSGFRLYLEGRVRDGTVREWTLRGDARLLGRIELNGAASQTVEPPRWSQTIC